jgi:hypothetical protein
VIFGSFIAIAECGLIYLMSFEASTVVGGELWWSRLAVEVQLTKLEVAPGIQTFGDAGAAA